MRGKGTRIPRPRRRELLYGGKQRRVECALALEQQAEPPEDRFFFPFWAK